MYENIIDFYVLLLVIVNCGSTASLNYPCLDRKFIICEEALSRLIEAHTQVECTRLGNLHEDPYTEAQSESRGGCILLSIRL